MSETEKKPKKWGCFHYLIIAALCFAILCYVAWSCLFRSIPLRISKETTYITEPLDATGKWVDYFRAMELKLYPPEMKTDDNGVRVLTRALGFGQETASPEFVKIYYEKLDLNPNVPPTHFFLEPEEYFKRAQTYKPDLYEAQKKKMYDRYVVSALDDFRNNTFLAEEEKERLIQEWESSQSPSAIEEETENIDAEVEKTLPLPMRGGMMSSGPELPQDYAAWEPNFYVDLQFYSRPWTVEENPLMEDWLNDCSPALDLIAEAVQKPAFMFPWVRLRDDDKFAMLAMLMPDVQAVRSYARGFSARANSRIAQGDFDGAFEDIIACYRLGRRAGHHGTTVGALVGLAIEGIACAIDFQFPGEKQPTAEQLRRFLDEIDNLFPRVAVELFIETERFGILETVLSIKRSAAGDSGIINTEYLSDTAPISMAISVIGVNWNVVFKHINERYDQLLAGSTTDVPFDFKPWKLLTLDARSELIAHTFEALLVPALGAAREAITRVECSSHLKRLVLAMLIYEKEHATLPPTFTVDANGKPLHSWRVLLLPYLGEDAKKLYDQIRLDEPWDSEHNTQFHTTTLGVFQCPSANKQKQVDGGTHYTVVVGNETAFGTDGQGRSSNDFKKNMILISERKDAICWMRPDEEISQTDAEFPPNKTSSGLGSFHTGGINVAMKAGGVRFISDTIDAGKQREMIVGTDGENP